MGRLRARPDARHLLVASSMALVLVACLPGTDASFGLPRALLAAACVVFSLLHSGVWPQSTASGKSRRSLVRAELLGWCVLAACASGRTPMAWAFVYFAAMLGALHLGRDRTTALLLLGACASANAARAFVWNALPAAAVAHSLAPALIYWLLGGHERQLAEDLERVRQLVLEERRALAHRRRLALAQELHDGAGGLLVAAVLQAQTSLLLLGTDSSRAAHAMGRARELVTRAQGELRALEADPPSTWPEVEVWLSELTLALAPSAALDLHVDDAVPPPDPRVVHALRRILGEALTNSVRHAEARRISAKVTVAARRLELVVSDDGRGCQGAAPGFGQRSIRERAFALGGSAHWQARALGGTELSVDLPHGEALAS